MTNDWPASHVFLAKQYGQSYCVCPYCGHKINDKAGPVDHNGDPIPTEQ